MISFNDIRAVYFLGIGGIGMSALARYFKASGKKVAGYDRTATSLTEALINEGIAVTYDESVEAMPAFVHDKASTLIIYTPAIPKEHRQFNYLAGEGFELHKRSVILGLLTENTYTIAVAGTHGKTTTSAIITHILKCAGVNCTAFLGGISVNYDSNFIQGDPLRNDHVMIVEADEYDRSFLTLHPDIAVITSMDADHLDIYKDKEHLEESYRLFAKQVNPGGILIARKGLKVESGSRNISYSLSSGADFHASGIEIKEHQYTFSISTPHGEFSNWTLGMPGRHNIENAVAATAACMHIQPDMRIIREALETFKGVKRRFEYHVRNKKCTFIDDYAHHPEEIRAVVQSVKELYADKKITGIFQPHLYSRTHDFAAEFAESLSLLDRLILLDIYPARELPMEGVTSKLIYDKVRIKDKMLCSKVDLPEVLKVRKPEVLLTLGAGDIDQLVEPIKQLLA